MADLTISVSVALVIAIVAGEVLSTLWYSDSTPWGRHCNARYLLSAIGADIGLGLLLQFIMRQYYSVRKWEDAAWLGLWLALLYAALEAPHVVHDQRSFSRFLFHVMHKFALMFAMAFCLWNFRDM